MTRRARIAVSGDPSAVAFARDRVMTQIQAWGVQISEENLNAVKLVASELITNAVLHAGGFITIGLYLDEDRLLLVVHDSSPSYPVVKSPRRTTKGARPGPGSSSLPQGTDGSRRATARRFGPSLSYPCRRRPHAVDSVTGAYEPQPRRRFSTSCRNASLWHPDCERGTARGEQSAREVRAFGCTAQVAAECGGPALPTSA